MGPQKAPRSLTLSNKSTARRVLPETGTQSWSTMQIQAELIEMSHDAIFIRDPDHHILSWSKGAETLFGWKAEEAIGQVAHNLFKTHFSYVDSGIEHTLENEGRWEGELIYTRRDGQQVVVSSRQALIRNQEGAPFTILEVDQDVTVYKQTQQALQEQLQLALVAQEIGLWHWNIQENRSAMLSNDVIGLFGLPAGTVYTYEQIMDVLHPDDRERVDQEVKYALANQTDYVTEYRVVWPDKSVRWLSVYGRPLYDEQGIPTRMVGISVDMTERKRTEEMLRKTNRKVTTILESITDGFMQLDKHWQFVYINRQGEELIQRNRKDILGKKIWDVLPGLQNTIFEEKAQQAMASQERIQYEAKFADNQSWFAVKIYPSDGGIAVYFDDVTEYKNTELALRISEAKFRRLVDSNMIGVMVVDDNGQILEANDAFLHMLDFTQEDLVHNQLNWRLQTPEDYAAIDDQALEDVKENSVCKPYEKEFYNKQKQRVPVLIAGARLHGETDKIICTVVDMTPQKELEKQKETFMSIVGHELRTPLTAINGSMQLAQRRIQKFYEAKDHELSADVESVLHKLSKLLEQSLRQTRVQNRLINDLLDISRLAVDRLELAIQPSDLIGIVRDIIDDLRYTESGHNIELRLPDVPSIPVNVDPDRIEQVISNYVSNAIKYSPPQAPIVVKIETDGQNARVWVQDQGPGLSPEAQKHIWNRFYRVAGVKDQHGSGVNLGLGLYICQVLIKRHNGQVGVESEEGKGSSFWFSLPIDQSRNIL